MTRKKALHGLMASLSPAFLLVLWLVIGLSDVIATEQRQQSQKFLSASPHDRHVVTRATQPVHEQLRHLSSTG